MQTIFIGIDVSKDTLHFAYETEKWQIKKIGNTIQKIEEEIVSLSLIYSIHCIVEYTGTYSSKIIYTLCNANIPVSVITPLQSKAYAQMKHFTSKTDANDSKLLAMYGKTNANDLQVYKLPDEITEKRKQLLTAIEQIDKMVQQTLNQQHAYCQLMPSIQQTCIKQTFSENIVFLGQKKQYLLNELNELDDNQDKNLKEQMQLIESVKGIGKKTATILIAKTNGIHLFESAKKLTKFIGIAPTQKESGTIKIKGKINKSGCSAIRKALYCCVWSAIKHNLAAKQLYQRLRAQGKSYKVATVAVMNLLVRQLFAVVNTQTPFDNEYYTKFLPQNI